MNQPSLDRRKALAGLGGLAAAGAVGFGAAGCAAPASATAGKTGLRYWHLFGGGDGVNMAALVDAFRDGLAISQVREGCRYNGMNSASHQEISHHA